MHHRKNLYLFTTLLISLLVLTGCFSRTTRLRQDQVIDITWETLGPVTSSQERNNWEVVNVARVFGRDVVSEFNALRISNCPGPTPPENAAIRASSEYWFVRVAPSPQTDKSPKASTPEQISPEPLFEQAQFLIDPYSGIVIARRFLCQ